MWDAEDFRGHAAAELGDFSNDQVGLPVLGDREQVGNHPLGVQASEKLPNPEERARGSVRRKRFELELKRGEAFVGSVSLLVEAGRDRFEPTAFNARME